MFKRRSKITEFHQRHGLRIEEFSEHFTWIGTAHAYLIWLSRGHILVYILRVNMKYLFRHTTHWAKQIASEVQPGFRFWFVRQITSQE
jgi:hypothetical protein